MKLYHGTHPRNVWWILKEGLKPNKVGNSYLAVDPKEAKHYGTILEVETGDLRLTCFDDENPVWQVLCWGRIPPQNIKLYGIC